MKRPKRKEPVYDLIKNGGIYHVTEIADALEITPEQAWSALRELKKQGKITNHAWGYWKASQPGSPYKAPVSHPSPLKKGVGS